MWQLRGGIPTGVCTDDLTLMVVEGYTLAQVASSAPARRQFWKISKIPDSKILERESSQGLLSPVQNERMEVERGDR